MVPQPVRRHHNCVIVMTGYSEQIRLAMAQGFTVLAKPTSAERLASVLQDALSTKKR